MMDSEKIKQDIIEKYDAETFDKNNEDWIKEGSSEHTPGSNASHYFIKRKVDQALKFSGDKKELRIMEIGCSFGQMTSHFAKMFNKVTAVDISPKSIEVTKKRLEHYGLTNIDFVVEDFEDLGSFENSSFDVIYSFSTIRYSTDTPRAFKKIYGKLDNNGIAVLDFPNKYCPWHLFIKKVLGIKKHIHDRLFSLSEIQSLYKNAGFTDFEYKYMLFTTKMIPDFTLPVLKIVDALFERIPIINRLAGVIMVKGVKHA